MSRSRAKSFIEDQKASEGDAAAPDGEPMQSLSRCLVYARLRPTKPGELNEKDGTYKLVELKGKRITLGQEKEYDFDGSFGGDSTQDEVFEAVAKPSLNHVLSGYTAAMMAYGQTGTGKSWTMSNSRPGQEGIIPRSAGYLFDHIAATKTKEYTLTAHFVQIYRDQLSDLMSDKEGQKVDITFNQKTGVSIQNCTETEVPDKAAFLKMYAEGDSRRIVRPTKMNPESSRGHSALVLYVRSRSTDPDDMSMPTNGKITFIDLAGYERFDKTGVKDPIHKDEAKKINASLLSLGGVVTELSNGGKFVSWRNSKLTRLLQDSIGGKARSTIMICLGPSSASLHETTNSLDFGNRAMAVKVSAKVEQDVDYQKLATKLQTLLDEQEEKINALELSEKTREAERSDRERRHKLDMERLRNRHRDELTKLMEEGGTKERIQKLLEMQEAEDQNLQEMQAEEREYEDERAADDEREMVHEIEQQHRVRAASMRKEGGAMKQRELDAAILLIAKLRGVDQDPAALLEIAAEVATEAGSGDGGGGGGGGDEADAEAASPKTVTSAEIAILARQLDELKKESEQKETKAKETMDKMKAAHLKCANLLKEQREKTREMQDSSVKREELESLQGQLEEMASARNEAHSLREAMEEKLDKVTKEMHKASSEKEKLEVEVKKATSLIEQLNALKDDLEQQLQVLQQEKEEITEEHNRKERDREAVREESEAASTRKATELEDTIADLKKSIAALESSVAELGAEKAEAEKQIESLGETLAEQKRVLAAEEEAKQTLQSLVDAEKAATLEAETKHSQRQRELESAVEQCRDETRCVQSDLLREIEKTEETCSLKVSGLETELVELRKLIDENEQDVTAGKTRVTDLEAEAAASKEREEALNTEIEELKTAAQATEEKLVAAGAAATAAQGEAGAELERLRGEVSETAEKLAAAEESLEQTKGELAAAQEKLTAEKTQTDELTARVSELDTALAAEKERASTLETQLEGSAKAGSEREQTLGAELAALTASLAESAKKVATAEDELAAAKEQLDDLEGKLEESEGARKEDEKTLQEADEELNEERKRAEDLEDERDALKNELDDFKAECADRFEKLESDHEEQLTAETERADQMEEEVATSQQYQELLEKRVEELEEKLGVLQGDMKEEKSKLQLEAEEMKRKQNDEKKQREDERNDLVARQAVEKAKALEEKKAMKAELEKQLEEEKKKRSGGKYKYSSKLVSQLAQVGQFAIPDRAPQVLKPEGFLASLDVEEVRAALPYNVFCVGALHTGKSSVHKLLAHTGASLLKKAPDVITPTANFSSVEYVSKDNVAGGGGFLNKKRTTNTYFNLWDTPCDVRALQALPDGFLPVAGSAFVVTFFLNHDFASEAKKMEEVLMALQSGVNVPEGFPRLPVLLVGTRKDLVGGSKDGLASIKKISEAKKWFRESPFLKEKFRLLDCFAVSVKDWSVQNDTGGGAKAGVTSFRQIMSMLSTELHQMYPITPPSLLGDSSPDAQADILEWWTANKEKAVTSDDARQKKSSYNAVLSAALHMGRMRKRGTWLIGQADFDSIVMDHIPNFTLEGRPEFATELKQVFERRGVAFSRRDAAFDDPREGYVVLDRFVAAHFLGTMLLPSLYLALVETYSQEKPGHLKSALDKATSFNVEEFWRPDWELVFDGKLSSTAASCVLKSDPVFSKDPVLGQKFLGSLGATFEHEKTTSGQLQYMPAMAVSYLSPDIQSLLLALFTKVGGGWVANSVKLDRMQSMQRIATMQKKVYDLDAQSLLWRDGVALQVDGVWGYVKFDELHITVACAGKASPALPKFKKLVGEAFFGPQQAESEWKDGLRFDELPRLPPAMAKNVDEATDIPSFFETLSKDHLRGRAYPNAVVEAEMRRRRVDL